MNIERLARRRDATANVLSPDLPEWAMGEKRKLYLAPVAVRSMAQNLIDDVHDHRHLRAAKLVIVMRTGVQPAADGRVELGKARKASPLLAFLCRGADFLITLNAGQWSNAERAGRLALLDHELSHCGVAVGSQAVPLAAVNKLVAKLGPRHLATRQDVTNADRAIVYFAREKAGKPVFALGKHDVEEFVSVAGRWGPWVGQLDRLAEALANPPEAEPGQLFDQPTEATG